MFDQGHNPNNATDTPDNSIFGSWGCADWMTWYGALKTAYGADAARTIWEKAWHDQGIFDTDLFVCRLSPTFAEFLKAEGLLIEHEILDDVINTGNETVTNIFAGIKNTTKVISYAVPAMLISIGVIILYGLARQAHAVK